MAFRLKPGAALPREVRRVFDRQMTAAIACLEAATPSPDRDRLHQARRRNHGARVVRALLAYRRDLESQARRVSGFYDERPAAFAQRVKALWGVKPAAAPEGSGAWRRVA